MPTEPTFQESYRKVSDMRASMTDVPFLAMTVASSDEVLESITQHLQLSSARYVKPNTIRPSVIRQDTSGETPVKPERLGTNPIALEPILKNALKLEPALEEDESEVSKIDVCVIQLSSVFLIFCLGRV